LFKEFKVNDRKLLSLLIPYFFYKIIVLHLFVLIIFRLQCQIFLPYNMAHRSQIKNHPMIPERGNRPGHMVPHGNDGRIQKPHPGYPGHGPPLPGPTGICSFQKLFFYSSRKNLILC
jgi:hypothetical protein